MCTHRRNTGRPNTGTRPSRTGYARKRDHSAVVDRSGLCADCTCRSVHLLPSHDRCAERKRTDGRDRRLCPRRGNGLSEAAIFPCRDRICHPVCDFSDSGGFRSTESIRSHRISDRRILFRALRVSRYENRNGSVQPNGSGGQRKPQPRLAGCVPFRRGHGACGRRLRTARHYGLVSHS